MAKKSPKKNFNKVLAIDIGGTKLIVAAVDARGKSHDSVREPVDVRDGAKTLMRQIVRLSQPLIKKHKLKTGAIASAGPLDPKKGHLLNPTNLKTSGASWGVVPLIAPLEKKLKIKLQLENDAVAAVLAESWIGAAKNENDVIAVTLGTGLGVGVLTNGYLVRGGRFMHTEAGHITIDYHDRDWLCGCGNFGCAEAFLSGTNFTKQMSKVLNLKALTGERLVLLARGGNRDVLEQFQFYGQRLATFLYSLCVLFSPKKIVISGGFSHAHDLFLPLTISRLAELLQTRRQGTDMLSQIVLSKFQDQACLIGAAKVAFQHHKLN